MAFVSTPLIAVVSEASNFPTAAVGTIAAGFIAAVVLGSVA